MTSPWITTSVMLSTGDVPHPLGLPQLMQPIEAACWLVVDTGDGARRVLVLPDDVVADLLQRGLSRSRIGKPAEPSAGRTAAALSPGIMSHLTDPAKKDRVIPRPGFRRPGP